MSGPLVGMLGADVPRELVLAAGGQPVRLPARPGPATTPDRDEARRLLGAVDEPAVDVLADLLTGRLDHVAGLLVSRDRDAWLRVFYVVRALRETRPDLPAVHLVDVVHLPRRASLRYTERQLHRCAEVLVRWTGTPVDADALAAAARATTGVRGALGRLQDARRSGLVSGTEAWQRFAAADEETPEDAVRAVDDLLRRAADRDALPGRPLFLSGSTQHDDSVHATLEAGGWRVVGEDHDPGALALTVELSEPPRHDTSSWLQVLAAGYARRGPDAPTATAADRAAWAVAEAERGGARAVLHYVRRHDEAPLWDLPSLRARADATGLAVAALRDQGTEPDGAALEASLTALAERTG